MSRVADQRPQQDLDLPERSSGPLPAVGSEPGCDAGHPGQPPVREVQGQPFLIDAARDLTETGHHCGLELLAGPPLYQRLPFDEEARQVELGLTPRETVEVDEPEPA